MKIFQPVLAISVLGTFLLPAAGYAQSPALPPLESISAEGYMVLNIADKTVVASKNENAAYSIASVTKLMNAVVALENVDSQKTITLTKPMLKPAGYSPSLFLNLRVSAANLLKASLIQSTNDAAESLSYFLGNKPFVAAMNARAKALGLKNTHYHDAHGLSLYNQSSPADVAALLTYIYARHPDILSISKDDNFWLQDPAGKLLKFKNQNLFYAMPEFVGGKTGYLPKAKNSLASVFEIHNKTYAVVLLKSSNLYRDTNSVMEFLKAIP